MKGHLARVLLCAALLTPAVVPGSAVAADKQPNEFMQDRKADLKYSGSITAIDAAAGSVTIKNKEKGPLTLSIAKGCLLFVKHKPGQAALADFKVGEEVHLFYSQAGAASMCHSMWQPGANPRVKEREVENKTKTP